MTTVLWVTPVAPTLDGGGGHIRQAHLLQSLSRHADVELILAGHLDDQRVRAGLASVIEVPFTYPTAIRPPTLRRFQELRQALLEPYPGEVTALRSARRRMAPVLEQRARAADVVCIEYAGLAPLLPSHDHARSVLTFHNLISGMAKHAKAIASGRRQRWFHEREYRKAHRLEQWAVSAYDLVISVSEPDARALAPGVAVIPNGVDTSRFHPSDLPAGHRVLLSGALYTLPNVDGAEWFCSHVLPRVRQHLPDATLDLVGLEPTPSVTSLARLPGVRVSPNVPSVLPYLEQARVCVVPLRIGTGTRLKALEALAAGRPLVGTSIGLGGLGLENGTEALVADDAHAFAAAVVRALTDDALAQRLAIAGRRLVETRFGWGAIGERYVELVLAGSRGNSPRSGDR